MYAMIYFIVDVLQIRAQLYDIKTPRVKCSIVKKRSEVICMCSVAECNFNTNVFTRNNVSFILSWTDSTDSIIILLVYTSQ